MYLDVYVVDVMCNVLIFIINLIVLLYKLCWRQVGVAMF